MEVFPFFDTVFEISIFIERMGQGNLSKGKHLLIRITKQN